VSETIKQTLFPEFHGLGEEIEEWHSKRDYLY
jgi:hypothetical protein